MFEYETRGPGRDHWPPVAYCLFAKRDIKSRFHSGILQRWRYTNLEGRVLRYPDRSGVLESSGGFVQVKAMNQTELNTEGLTVAW